MHYTVVNLVIINEKSKINNQMTYYLQAWGRRFESDYLHQKGAAPDLALPPFGGDARQRRCRAQSDSLGRGLPKPLRSLRSGRTIH